MSDHRHEGKTSKKTIGLFQGHKFFQRDIAFEHWVFSLVTISIKYIRID